MLYCYIIIIIITFQICLLKAPLTFKLMNITHI